MRYFFDLDGDGGKVADVAGLECSGAVDMRFKAMKILADIAGDTRSSSGRLHLYTHVRDADGVSVYEARLSIEGRELI